MSDLWEHPVAASRRPRGVRGLPARAGQRLAVDEDCIRSPPQDGRVMHHDRVAGTISAFMARHPHGRSGAHGVALKMPENRHRVPIQTRSAKTNGTTSPGFCGLPGGYLAQPAV